MDKLTFTLARTTALTVASEEGLRDITDIIEEFHDGTCSFYVYGTMYDLDPDTYEIGRALRVIRVVDGKIDLVDGQ